MLIKLTQKIPESLKRDKLQLNFQAIHDTIDPNGEDPEEAKNDLQSVSHASLKRKAEIQTPSFTASKRLKLVADQPALQVFMQQQSLQAPPKTSKTS